MTTTSSSVIFNPSKRLYFPLSQSHDDPFTLSTYESDPHHLHPAIRTNNNVPTMSPIVEAKHRYNACSLMVEISKKLGFPSRTYNTAQYFFHRFYHHHSIHEHPPRDLAISCLFVATKIQETVKKLKDFVKAIHAVESPDTKLPDDSSADFENRRRKITYYERVLLEGIGFDFWTPSPSKYVIKFCKHLKVSKELCKEAWLYSIESFFTTASLHFSDHTIALGCLIIAAQVADLDEIGPFPCNRLTDLCIHLNCQVQRVQNFCWQLLSYFVYVKYANDPIQVQIWQPRIQVYQPMSVSENTH